MYNNVLYVYNNIGRPINILTVTTIILFTECHALTFEGNPEENIPGKMTIEPYLFIKDKIYMQTAFKITFSSIEWQCK